MQPHQLHFDTNKAESPVTWNPEHVGVSSAEVFKAISQFDEIGVWRAELDSGLVYWTRSVFNIFGIEPVDGPVSIGNAINAYHPDDREIVLKAYEEAAQNRSGFRFVLRACRPDGEQIWVKSHGLCRTSQSGKDELFGYIEKFSPRTRSVTVLENQSNGSVENGE